jgi:hypothetical protein
MKRIAALFVAMAAVGSAMGETMAERPNLRGAKMKDAADSTQSKRDLQLVSYAKTIFDACYFVSTTKTIYRSQWESITSFHRRATVKMLSTHPNG